jgi:hypothetical protein
MAMTNSLSNIKSCRLLLKVRNSGLGKSTGKFTMGMESENWFSQNVSVSLQALL